MQAGIWLLDEWAAELARLYNAALGRRPDAAGLAAWKADMHANRKSLLDVADAFTDSLEFRPKHGGLDRDIPTAVLFRKKNALPGASRQAPRGDITLLLRASKTPAWGKRRQDRWSPSNSRRSRRG